jgi:hypothetical protein
MEYKVNENTKSILPTIQKENYYSTYSSKNKEFSSRQQ